MNDADLPPLAFERAKELLRQRIPDSEVEEALADEFDRLSASQRADALQHAIEEIEGAARERGLPFIKAGCLFGIAVIVLGVITGRFLFPTGALIVMLIGVVIAHSRRE